MRFVADGIGTAATGRRMVSLGLVPRSYLVAGRSRPLLPRNEPDRERVGRGEAYCCREARSASSAPCAGAGRPGVGRGRARPPRSVGAPAEGGRTASWSRCPCDPGRAGPRRAVSRLGPSTKRPCAAYAELGITGIMPSSELCRVGVEPSEESASLRGISRTGPGAAQHNQRLFRNASTWSSGR